MMNHLTHRYYTELAQNYFQFFFGGGGQNKSIKNFAVPTFIPRLSATRILTIFAKLTRMLIS